MRKSRKAADRKPEDIERGKLLKRARLAVGLEQTEVAEEIGRSSIAVSHYEGGYYFPEPDALLGMARLYKRTPEQLGFEIRENNVYAVVGETRAKYRSDSAVLDHVLGRRIALPVWEPTGPGMWRESIPTRHEYVRQSLTQGKPCFALVVGAHDKTLEPTAYTGNCLVASRTEAVPPGRWVVCSDGMQVQIRGFSSTGRLLPLRRDVEQEELNPEVWKPIAVVLGVDRDPEGVILDVVGEPGGIRFRE